MIQPWTGPELGQQFAELACCKLIGAQGEPPSLTIRISVAEESGCWAAGGVVGFDHLRLAQRELFAGAR